MESQESYLGDNINTQASEDKTSPSFNSNLQNKLQFCSNEISPYNLIKESKSNHFYEEASNEIKIENIKENNNENINNETTNKEECSSPRKKISIEDFEISYVLGKGSYAKVVLAKNIHSLKDYALKIIDKKFLKRVN